MKKLLLALLSVGLFMSSCKKDQVQENPGTGKKMPVKISIADFLQKIENLPSIQGRAANAPFTRDSLHNIVSHIYCFIGDYADNRVSFRYQAAASSGSNFGTITDTLAPGTYRVRIAASTAPLAYSASPGFNFFRGYDQDGWFYPTPDVFSQSVLITVDSSGSVSYVNVSLDRIVGKLEVNILDAAVADSNISVRVFNDDIIYDFITEASSKGMGDFYNLRLSRESQKTFSGLVLNTNGELTVYITYLDKNTHITTTKEVSGVKCYKNKKTTLTGYLYGAPQPTGNRNFVVGINDIWGPDAPSKSF